MAHYILNYVEQDAARAQALLRAGMWSVDDHERHRDALRPGDLVLVYLGAPHRELIGRAVLASAAHEWTPSEAEAYTGDAAGGVLLAHVEEWDPPVQMSAVLSEIASPTAKADFEAGVVEISAHEYETAVAVAARRSATGSSSA